MFSIKKNLNILTEGAIAISFCTVLSFFPLFNMPWGGCVTLGQTVPLILFSFKNGIKEGFKFGCIFGIVNVILAFHIPPAKSLISFGCVILFDYLIPYALVGLTCFYGKLFSNKRVSLVFGCIFSHILRLMSVIISGVLVWKEYIPCSNNNIFMYVFLYNFSYIFPEMIISCFICIFISKFLFSLKSRTSFESY